MEMKRNKKAAKDDEEDHDGTRDTWCLFVRLIQRMWESGEIPGQMLLLVEILISKGDAPNAGLVSLR